MDRSVRGRDIYPGYVLDARVEDEIALVASPGTYRAALLASGSAFVAVNGVQLFLQAPAVLCLGSADILEARKADRAVWRQVFFKPTVINPELTDERIGQLLSGAERQPGDSGCVQDMFYLHPFCGIANRIVPLGPTSFERVMAIFDSLKHTHDAQADLFWPCRSRTYLIEILFILRNAVDPSSDIPAGFSGGDDRFERILLYLHTQYGRDISMGELCERFGINRTSLNELFHRHTGMPVIQYLIALRIKLACLMLRDTTLPVKEVVERTGFNDVINFSRAFKKRTSRTPAGYRQEFCYMLRS